MAAPILEVHELRKCYGPTTALAGVSFAVGAGEMFGLLGPNGAGKTTLLSIASCLLEASDGEVRIDGRVLRTSDKDVRRLIGIVPQELAIYGELTARENLHFFGALYGLPRAVLRQRVEEVLQAIGLTDRGDARADTFSGGMKRRLNLGAALVHEPRLLLLDEPTSGVDPQSRNHVFEEVRRLNAAGVTVVYTSHYMEEVQALCSRIGIIDHGRLIALGTLPELLQRLTGLVRFRVPAVTTELRRRLSDFPDATLGERNGDVLELQCRDVKTTLQRLLGLLNDLRVEFVSLETEEPNLERVFLHLTGRALRD
ncbi:MAG TPA: ABC transporter ATP-binding protein [Gemmataceae bacterium]|nr:ABC transporter ATP-binding protein [Gemmataceae bacterium]